MYRKVSVISMLLLVFAAGCGRKESTAARGGEESGRSEGHMDEKEYTKDRTRAAERSAGAALSPVGSAEELLGTWEMRLGGPMRSDKVQWVYEFARDGKVKADGETWTWRLNANGRLSLFVTMPADPTVPGPEEETASEERRYVFKAQDGRLVLCNEDASVIELLSKAAAQVGR